MTFDVVAIGQWLLIAVIVGGGVTIGRRNENKKIAKALNDETSALVLTRGEIIDDLRDEVAFLEAKLLRSEAVVEYLEKHPD